MTEKKFIIGLTGYAGTGKDAVRSILEERGFIGFAFADPIRSMLRELLTSNGISDEFIDSRELKESIIPELGVSYRQMAQTLGTEWGRMLQPDLWLRLAGAYMADVERNTWAESTCFVISDVRFANEAQWVRDHGGVIWRIERPSAMPVRAHVSEQELYHFTVDHTIDNSGTLDMLESTVLYALGAMV
mgnify:CR=1 FL=1